MGPAMATTRPLNNTQGSAIPPTVFPYGPQWEGKVAPYTPSYNTPHSPGQQPPPLFGGTLRRSTLFPTEPEPAPLHREGPFGTTMHVTFELRRHSSRNQASGQSVRVSVGNHLPLGRIIDAAVQEAYRSGALQGESHRILSVCGPSGKLLKVGSGLTLYDQSPPVPPGSTLVLVFQD